jgi:phytoene synthase
MNHSDRQLAASYDHCRAINRRHGTTYYWSTMLLAGERRPHVHALYAFCRHADDIVDDLGDAPVAERGAALQAYGDEFRRGLAEGRSDDIVLAAVVDTVRRFSIDASCFDRFLRSMTMDLSVSHYETYADLEHYMDGSAAVIGEMMLPVLGATEPDQIEPARALGIAFQLTNFLRDVEEDLRRNRVYLPQEDLRRFGADPTVRAVTPEWRALMRFEIERTREIYAVADRGIDRLPGRSAGCMRAARMLYSEILDEIEAADFDVFTRRASVGLLRKLTTVARFGIGRPRSRRRTTTASEPSGRGVYS